MDRRPVVDLSVSAMDKLTSEHDNKPCRHKWVPVTTAWPILRLRMEERPPDMESSNECID
jgi:hypothetical protein